MALAMTETLLSSRWVILAIVFLARCCIGFQFIAVAAQMPQLRADLHFDYSQIRILLGVFMIAGAVLSLPSGMIAQAIDGQSRSGCLPSLWAASSWGRVRHFMPR